MIVGWAVFYTTLSLITVAAAWRSDARWIALALLIECLATNAIGQGTSPDSSPAVNAMLDIGVMIVASFSTLSRPGLGVIIIIMATLGCVLGLAYSAHQNDALLNQYEVRANVLFMLKCIAVLLARLLDVAGYRVVRFVRWRAHRRRAANAAARIRLARTDRS